MAKSVMQNVFRDYWPHKGELMRMLTFADKVTNPGICIEHSYTLSFPKIFYEMISLSASCVQCNRMTTLRDLGPSQFCDK